MLRYDDVITALIYQNKCSTKMTFRLFKCKQEREEKHRQAVMPVNNMSKLH